MGTEKAAVTSDGIHGKNAGIFLINLDHYTMKKAEREGDFWQNPWDSQKGKARRYKPRRAQYYSENSTARTGEASNPANFKGWSKRK